jgi:exopolysaccharide biosynthesis protein
MMVKILLRVGIALLVMIVFLAASLYATLYNVVHGASPTVRDMLVQSAMQASATKWLPGLFLDEYLIGEIISSSAAMEMVDIADLLPAPVQAPAQYGLLPEDEEVGLPLPDPWENAIGGMKLEIYIGPTFKAYILLVRDPARVFTAKPKGKLGKGRYGIQVHDVLKFGGIAAAINGGGFYDPGGRGAGGQPLGLTYSEGECVWEDKEELTFIGFDKNDRLIVEHALKRVQADELGVRDGVCFQDNSTLIRAEDGLVTAYYSDADSSLAQRTAIGQRADGTVILMVTEGRTAAYLGANRNDIINAMLYFDAVTAGMLDGGSSTVMCYPDYYEKYDVDTSNLNRYQKLGLLNSTRSFVPTRALPTYFAVKSYE